jgi:hypothetical protein
MARKRVDPMFRPPSGVQPWERLTNLDPDRHYVWVNPNEPSTGAEYYAGLGYEPEKYRKDGPKPRVAHMFSEGSTITCQGLVLMSCPMEHRLQMDADGQARVDAYEARIVRPGGIDGFRGMGPGTKIVNETTESFNESGV